MVSMLEGFFDSMEIHPVGTQEVVSPVEVSEIANPPMLF